VALIRTKEQQAEDLAHMLDDIFHVPGTSNRIGTDPLLGLVPIVGDAIATILGARILMIARQLNVPWHIIANMAFNQFKNGLIGVVPFVGDLYSFGFKSNAKNAALLLRAGKHGKAGTRSLTTRPLTIQDVVGLTMLILPTLGLVAFASVWFWNHNITYVSLFFPTPYLSR
jgi:hypothetical protein